MKTNVLQSNWAIVTGASSGLGVDFAKELAQRKMNLVLVARRRDRLEAVAREIREHFGVEVEVMELDLGTAEGPKRLFEVVEARGYCVDVLINNAGFGNHGAFIEVPLEQDIAMLNLNVLALVQLSKLFCVPMVQRGFGRIVQVSSIAAYQPTPTFAAYGAAKAFVQNFSEALHRELKGTGVTCTAVAPGATATEFSRVAGHVLTRFQSSMMMSSARVARLGILAMEQGRAAIVTGFINALSAFLTRFFPRSWMTYVAYRIMNGEPK